MKRMALAEVRRRHRLNYTLLLRRVAETSRWSRPTRTCRMASVLCSSQYSVEQPHDVVRGFRAPSIPAIPWRSGDHLGGLNWESFPDACFLKEHLVALPIHQQLGETAMESISWGLRNHGSRG